MDKATDRQVISPAKHVRGRLRVPGDKSISHRALLISAVGNGSCRIAGLSSAADVRSTAAALRALGVVISDSQSQVEPKIGSAGGSELQILVKGHGWEGLTAPLNSLDCENSGTTARILMGILAGMPFATELTGDESLRRRPMLRVVEPLRRMGASIEGERGGDRLPIRVQGGTLEGIEYELPVASAQVKSAILMAGLQASGNTTVREPTPTRDHTERLLEYLGVPIYKEPNRFIIKSTNIQNVEELRVPGDLSSGAFLLAAAALLPDSEVTIEEVGLNPTRTGFLDVLRRYGADVLIEGQRDDCGEPKGTVTVRPGDRRPMHIDPRELSSLQLDELPLVGVLGAFAEGETEIRGAAELRVKESDRITTVAAGLGALGAAIRPLEDGFVVTGSDRLAGGVADSGGDHRIAMALAVAALAADGPTTITGWGSVAVSYPEFLRDLNSVIRA